MCRNKYKVFTVVLAVMALLSINIFAFIVNTLNTASSNLASVYDIDSGKTNDDEDKENLSEIIDTLMEDENVEIEEVENTEGIRIVVLKYKGLYDEMKRTIDKLKDLNDEAKVDKIYFADDEFTVMLKF